MHESRSSSWTESQPAPNRAVSLPGFHSPSVGTEAPLEMLAACHGRVERQCDTLRRLQKHLPAHGSDASAQQAAEAVMRYFDTAARHHHADEEDDLFPALLESMAGSDAVCIRELIEGLTAEHRVLERRWLALRERLQSVAAGQPLTLEADLLDALIDAFVEAYRAHIVREDTELLPMAARLLDTAALQQIGTAMRQRRGITDPV